MGRGFLILALLLGACRGSERAPAVTSSPGDSSQLAFAAAGGQGHDGMACAACHAGPRADLGRASVPRETCMSAQCHADGGPERVRTGTIEFRHRNHGRDGEVVASCAGCHDHHGADEPLHVEVGACALCHVDAVSGEKVSDCRLCHQNPNHVALSSQALPIPHSTLPWVETGCVRCHYDVAEPLVKVSSARCASCHEDLARVTAEGIGDNLHPSHAGVGCTSCHQAGAHRVKAMSSAVSLVCSDCHNVAHQLALPGDFDRSETCGNCHKTVHQAQQRLLLGVIGDGGIAAPSTKFLAGVTCRSCHIRTATSDTGNAALRGQAQACADCHRNEYRSVLQWWLRGGRERTRTMVAFSGRAATDLRTANDTSRALVNSARDMLDLVQRAGAQHNLELADRIFRDSRQRLLDAYRLAGRAAPAPPDLGTAAHEGFCSYCHYAPDDPWNYRSMPADFHEKVMGRNKK